MNRCPSLTALSPFFPPNQPMPAPAFHLPISFSTRECNYGFISHRCTAQYPKACLSPLLHACCRLGGSTHSTTLIGGWRLLRDSRGAYLPLSPISLLTERETPGLTRRSSVARPWGRSARLTRCLTSERFQGEEMGEGFGARRAKHDKIALILETAAERFRDFSIQAPQRHDWLRAHALFFTEEAIGLAMRCVIALY